MAAFRESAFMPTIKCSQCGSQVEISMMGDHKCSGAPVPQLSSSISEGSFENGTGTKSGGNRGAPPNLDTIAANQPFITRGQLTPVSNSSGSRSLSPHTPDGRSRGSTEFYEPGIAAEDPAPSLRGRTGGYGGLNNDNDNDNDNQFQQPPPSPAKPTGLLERMNTIAPGPFEVRGRQSSGLSDTLERPSTSHSMVSNGNSSRALAPQQPRKTGYGGFGPPSPSASQTTFPVEDFAPRPLGDDGRADTFPRTGGALNPMQGNNLGGPQAPPTLDHNRTPSVGHPIRDTSRPPPPRNGGLVRPRTSGRDGPQIDLAQEFGVRNPYHSAHRSVSSVASSAYPGSPPNPSSSSSGMPTQRMSGRKPSDMNVMNDVQQSMNNMSMDRSPRHMPPQHQRVPSAEMSRMTPPQQQQNMVPPLRPYKPPVSDDTSSFLQQPQPPSRPPREDLFEQSKRPEPPRQASRDELMTPQPQTRSRQSSRDDYMNKNNSSNNNTTTQYRNSNEERQQARQRGTSRGASRDGSATPSPPRTSTNSNSPRSAASSSRGNCKACTLPITGKSISSADGRLTGRYHKACFTCTTCQAPFTSGEFYVYSDRPYCERHYHQLNGSLCGSCRSGIEGQYLEDERQTKYHVNCFRCADCSRPLTDGYFEVDSRVYCERDARSRVAQPPVQRADTWTAGDRGNNNMQRPPSRGQSNQGSGPRGPPIGNRGPSPRGPGMSMGMGGSMRPVPNGQQMMGGRGGPGGPGQFVGLPRGQKVPPSQSGLAPPRPRMNKRMTRLGMM